MTEENKKTIQEMRFFGKGYKAIAKETGINEGTIKTYCHRHGLDRAGLNGNVVMPDLKTKLYENCGARFILYPGRKVPRFCCSACRIK